MNNDMMSKVRMMMLAQQSGAPNPQPGPAAGPGGMAATNPMVAMLAQQRARMGGQPQPGAMPQRGQQMMRPGADPRSMLSQAMLSQGQRGGHQQRPMMPQGNPMQNPMAAGPDEMGADIMHDQMPDGDGDDAMGTQSMRGQMMQQWRGRPRPMY